MNSKFDNLIKKKELQIADSNQKIAAYQEKIKSLKKDIHELEEKKKAACSKKFVEMCEKSNLDFNIATLERLFASAGITLTDDKASNSNTNNETTEGE